MCGATLTSGETADADSFEIAKKRIELFDKVVLIRDTWFAQPTDRITVYRGEFSLQHVDVPQRALELGGGLHLC